MIGVEPLPPSSPAPRYLATYASGALHERCERARERLRACNLCPRGCGVDRLAGHRGTCGTGPDAEVASHGAHFGEESPLVGWGGSGTIFLSGCNLRCLFCQNYDISQRDRGARLTSRDLGRLMLSLQARGCHNVNWVTPSHQLPALLDGLRHAIALGLRIPVVYNSSGYDSVDALELLDGVVDIYMPDCKSFDARCARTYLRAPDYPDVVRRALREMQRQVGALELDERGIAARGVLLRHLVMPAGLAATRAVLRFVRDELSPDTYVNLMAQWHPAGEAQDHPEIDRRVTMEELASAHREASDLGLERLDRRDPLTRLRRR